MEVKVFLKIMRKPLNGIEKQLSKDSLERNIILETVITKVKALLKTKKRL